MCGVGVTCVCVCVCVCVSVCVSVCGCTVRVCVCVWVFARVIESVWVFMVYMCVCIHTRASAHQDRMKKRLLRKERFVEENTLCVCVCVFGVWRLVTNIWRAVFTRVVAEEEGEITVRRLHRAKNNHNNLH